VLSKPYDVFGEIKLDKWKDGRNRERVERVLERVAPWPGKWDTASDVSVVAGWYAATALWLLHPAATAAPVRAAWREPVLRHPVLIIESDDWGPGPAQQAKPSAAWRPAS
jgi:hypothetical protein